MFETSGVLNEELLKELKKYDMSPKRKKFFITFSIAYSLMGLLLIILGLFASSIYFIFFGVFFEGLAVISIWIIFNSANKFQKFNMDGIKESSEKGEFELKVFFNENGAVINNLTTSAIVEIKYEFFNRFLETSNTYSLVTKANQYAIVFKDCLDNEQTNNFKEFIKEKCKNIE